MNKDTEYKVVAELETIEPKQDIAPKQELVQQETSTEPDDSDVDAESTFLDRIFGGDKVLWIIISFLVFMSVLVVYSSTASLAYRTLGGDTSFFLFDQLKNLALGMLSMMVFYLIPYRYYGRFAWPAYILAFILVLCATFFGETINNASRWLVIPIINMSFQQSDFLRVALIVLLCKRMNALGDNLEKVYLLPNLFYKREAPSNAYIIEKYTIPLLLPIAISCFFIMIANLSTAGMIFATCCAIFYMSRVRTREVMKLILWVATVVILLVSFMAVLDLGRSRTWVNRGTSFVGVSIFERAEGSDDDYQEEQAQITVASGGLFWGKGPGQSTQRSNLPHSYSDFAYAFIIEEYGDLMAFLVMMLYLWLFARSRIIARKMGTQFPSTLVLGLSFMITFQALMNMTVSVGIAPITGQTLPLISKGGSSMIFTGMALGMILSVSRQAETKELQPKLREKSMVTIRNTPRQVQVRVKQQK